MCNNEIRYKITNTNNFIIIDEDMGSHGRQSYLRSTQSAGTATMMASMVESNGVSGWRGTRVAESTSPNINANVNSNGSVAPEACNT